MPGMGRGVEVGGWGLGGCDEGWGFGVVGIRLERVCLRAGIAFSKQNRGVGGDRTWVLC